MDTTPPSIRKDLRDLYRHEWPEWWDCCRECSPGMAAVGVAAMAPLTAAYIAYSVWIKYSPWSDYRRGISREKSFRSFAFGQDELAGTMVADFEPLPRPGDAAMPKDGFFDALPYEIRTMILNLAFGEQTLHMDLQFRRPYEKTRIKGMHGELPVRKMKRDGQMAVEEQWSKKRSWIWYSCVCHRCPPNAHSCLSHGRIANHGLVPDLDPEQDTCLLGKACCSEWHGEEGKKCYVGVMGWLLTCKKA